MRSVTDWTWVDLVPEPSRGPADVEPSAMCMYVPGASELVVSRSAAVLTQSTVQREMSITSPDGSEMDEMLDADGARKRETRISERRIWSFVRIFR